MSKILLDNPTIKDLIEALKQFDDSTPIRIEDADTEWEIDKIHIKFEEGKVWLFGEYYEMGTKS